MKGFVENRTPLASTSVERSVEELDEGKAPRRIVIVGAVAAGTSAAAKARRNDEQAEIIIYEKDAHISYSGCGLPYYIGGQVPSLAELTPRDPAFFRSKYQVDIHIQHEVLAIDTARKRLQVRDLATGREFEDHYDTLVLATGATAVVLPISGAHLPHVFTLRSPSDAQAIRTFITGEAAAAAGPSTATASDIAGVTPAKTPAAGAKTLPATAVVLGSGFIGLEMVENLILAGLKVTLVEKLPQICPFLDPDMAPYLHEHLLANGVAVVTGQGAHAIESERVILEDGTAIPADLVIMAVGIRPAIGLARSIGATLGPSGAIAVDRQMRTSVPDVYACGDCAESFSIVDGKPLYRPLGSTANKMGRIAGDALTGGPLTHRGIAGTGIFRAFELSVAATGLREAEARARGFDVVVCHNIKPDKPEYFGGREMVIKAIAERADGRLLGVQIVGPAGVDKRIDVFVTAMTAGLTAADLFHLDLAYAPPFATTKDPVIYTGMILDNAISRGRELLTDEALERFAPGEIQVVDARVTKQYAAGHVADAVSLPHEVLREHLGDLDPEKPVVTYCNKGTTGNAAQNILLGRGFRTVYNLSGGYRQYRTTQKGRAQAGAGREAQAAAHSSEPPAVQDRALPAAEADQPTATRGKDRG